MKTSWQQPKITRLGSVDTMMTIVISLIVALVVVTTKQDSWHHHQSSSSSPWLVEASSLIDASSLSQPPPPPSSLLTNHSSNHQQRMLATASQIQATFATPNQAINITHVTYDPLHDTLYLGATNTLYQLNGSDLSIQHEQTTGPVLDNPACGITECHGGPEDFMKPTANVNKALVIDYQHRKLISCGSTKQGACRRYELDNIAQAEDLIPMAVAANDDNSSTYAFIAPARYTYDPAASSPMPTSALGGLGAEKQQQQQVLYVASTYTRVGQSRELLVPAIGTRLLDDGPNLLKLYENSFLDSARIDINSHLRDYFLVNYLYGFASSNYVYFVTVQKKATSRDFEELGYHTRLARICITDSSYNSYTEVDLKCVPNKRKLARQQPLRQQQKSSFFGGGGQQQVHDETPNEYPLLQDAILVDAGSQLLASLGQSDQMPPGASGGVSGGGGGGATLDDQKVLLGVFSSARDHTQHAGDHSAVCAFSLAQIEEKFNDNIHSCYTGKMQSRNMEYIAGNVQECPKNGQGGNVVNFCHETLKINGTIPIVSEASIQYYNTTLTAITATSHINTHQASSSSKYNIYSEQLASELPAQAQAAASDLNSVNHSGGGNGQPRQHTVVFAGTANGHIKKILLNNASNGIEFEDLQLDPQQQQQPILSDLHLHSSGRQLIAATPYKVFKVATHNCGQHTSCRECSQSKNPYCGWCLLKKSCTTKSECIPPSSSGAPLASTRIGLDAQQQQKAQQLLLHQQQQQQQPKWISSESSGKCIDLQSIVPDKIPMTSTGKVDLHIDRLPRLPKEHSYKCVFNRSEQTTASVAPFGLSCPLPRLMDRSRHIQIEPGRDHAVVELAVRSSETNTDFLDGKITFFDCQRHTTCKDCLTTNWGCNWCLNENVCLFNTSKCEKSSATPVNGATSAGSGQRQQSLTSGSPSTLIVAGSQQHQRGHATLITSGQSSTSPANLRNSNTIGLVAQCPTFDVGHKQDILIADGSEKELSIRVKNMPQFKGPMKCIVSIENYVISLKAQINEDRVICENSTYSYAADVGLLQGQLQVMYSDSNIFIDRTNFTLYKCHLLGAYLNRPDCSLCQRIDSRFQCAWCSGSCRHRARCSPDQPPDDSCPPPRIDFVHPLSGPALGGTRVTIEGSNLGQSFEEIARRVTIGNVPCRPLEEEYRPSNRIVCLTSPVVATGGGRYGGASAALAAFDSIAGDIVVGNKVGYTIGTPKFLFKPIYLRDVQPRYGPQSGGTRLTLSGSNLNIGSSVQVFLDELPCLVDMNSLTSEQLVCRTTSSRQASRQIRELRLIIDDAQLVRDDLTFYYTADPLITKVSPLRAYLSGGRPINVFGANLTVVQAPRMAIHDATTGKKINESFCQVQDDTRMQCSAPAVNLHLMDLEYAEQLSSYDPASQAVFSSPTTSGWQQSTTGGSNQAKGASTTQQMFQQDEMVKFRVSFVMDSVLQTSYPQLQTEIAYTSDPRLFTFASAQYKSAAHEADSLQLTTVGSTGTGSSTTEATTNQQYQIEPDTYLLQPGEPTLVLYGEHLRAALSEYEITVTVGRDQCNLTQLTPNRLVCLLPLDRLATPTDEDGHQTERELPLVVVRIGFNLRYELGFVQYHPQLVDQILASIANQSAHQTAQMSSFSSQFGPSRGGYSSSMATMGNNMASRGYPMQSAYPQYLPRESESVLHKISSFITSCVLALAYLTLASLVLGFVYSSVLYGRRLRAQADEMRHHKQQLARVEALERSLKPECRHAALALQAELGELAHHVEMSGVPLLSAKQYIMKVFFPGMNNHPLLQPQQHLPAQLTTRNTSADFPMEHFERLVLTKPFLLAFINTLERQPSFTIRDKVNVASLLMIVLLDRLDYATDILKTLLFQLVERSVKQLAHGETTSKSLTEEDYDYDEDEMRGLSRTTRKLTRRASNLLNGLPIGKRSQTASQLGKVVSGSASSLMAQTSVAAQMLLARVGHKTSPLDHVHEHEHMTVPSADCLGCNQQHANSPLPPVPPSSGVISPLDCSTLGQLGRGGPVTASDYMSTTTFNNGSIYQSSGHTTGGGGYASRRSSLSRREGKRVARKQLARSSRRHDQKSRQARLMLRRTDSIVEKMLTNWLALNMRDYFRGQVGQSMYMLFESLRNQLERGPIDATSGDAYYSLSEHKLLRDPAGLQFDVVNLYVIVDTDILHHQQQPTANLLLDSGIYEGSNPQNRFNTTNNRVSQQSFASQSTTSTITLALRVLDCDTISQVKGKILASLYKNTPNSMRLGPNDVELSLRQHQPPQPNGGHHQTLALGHQQQLQYITVSLQDEDYTSLSSYGGSSKRLNTLRHYGVADQAIMMLKRGSGLGARSDHYSTNPYTEIQYGQCGGGGVTTSAAQRAQERLPGPATKRPWHLIRADTADRTSSHLSDHSNDSSSSPAGSHSPSMMLLGGNHHSSSGVATAARVNATSHQHQRMQQNQFYHPSSSSTSSTGNRVMDTNSTSANSIAHNNQALMARANLARSGNLMVANQQEPQHLQQPIYCQIGSISAQSQHGGGGGGQAGGSQYYCQIGGGVNASAQHLDHYQMSIGQRSAASVASKAKREQEQNEQLARMLTTKGTIQKYTDDFFRTILTAPPHETQPGIYEDPTGPATVMLGDGTTRVNQAAAAAAAGACPPAVKWIFDLLDEAAIKNGISDQNVIHAWKSNAFLLRFWVNFIKNPNYILDVEKTNTLDASLSVIAQTLMDSCTPGSQKIRRDKGDMTTDNNRLVFSKDLPKYKEMVKHFYQDIASMRPVSDQEMLRQMSQLSATNNTSVGKFDTNLALKELCVYAVNYGIDIMNTLNSDYACQQLELSQQLEQCFRSFTIFEAYQ